MVMCIHEVNIGEIVGWAHGKHLIKEESLFIPKIIKIKIRNIHIFNCL